MTTILSIDIGQVGNKKREVKTSRERMELEIEQSSCILNVALIFSRSLSYERVRVISILEAVWARVRTMMYESSSVVCSTERLDWQMTSFNDDQQQWTSTFERLFSSYQRYNELRRKDDAIK